jgi:peptide/nickel transport system permease protein
LNYLTKRALTYLVVFFVVLNLTFILPRLVPGNAAEILASGTRVPTQAAIAIAARFGFGRPEYIQYFSYLRNVFLTWPPWLGVSYGYYPATVTSLFAVRIGWSLGLVFLAFFFGFLLTYFLAAKTLLKRKSVSERGSLYASIAYNSVPLFWISMVLLFVFAIHFKIFPLFGNVGFNAGSGLSYVESVIWHGILPVLVLTLSIAAEGYLILRGSAQEILKTNYILAAKTRGLTDWTVSTGYLVRNSLLPLVSILSFSLASLISRVILIEYVFGYPGVGDLFVDAVFGRDYPVIEGSFFYLTIMVIVGGLIGDILLVRLDPRLKG